MLLTFWQNYLDPLFKSDFLLVLATFIAGYIGLRVYRNQKEDEKRSAAGVIVQEIESAEEALKKVSVDQPYTEPRVTLMATASWDKYKHLLVSDFASHRDELDKISGFYTPGTTRFT